MPIPILRLDKSIAKAGVAAKSSASAFPFPPDVPKLIKLEEEIYCIDA